MRKLMKKAFALLVAGTIIFTSTGFTTLAANTNENTTSYLSGNFMKVLTDSQSNLSLQSNTSSNTSATTSTVTTYSTSTDDTTSSSTTDATDSSNSSTTNSTDTSNSSEANATDTTTTDSTDNGSTAATGVTDTDSTNDTVSDNSQSSESNVDQTSDTATTSMTGSDNDTSLNTTNETNGEIQGLLSEKLTASVLDSDKDTTNEVNNYTWNSIAFGQSTDLNFSSSILPEKIGTQYAKETQISYLDTSVTDATPEMKDAIVIESRGGKIANAHDGLTYYYTTLPTDKNFVLEAKVFINQFGPETGAAPSKQEAVGIMARDILGAPRQDPMLEGYEELPAASNVASTMVVANEKLVNSALNISSYQRNGVFYPNGNAHVSYGYTKISQINSDKAQTITKDITPLEGANYNSSDFFTIRLERTNDGFITTYIDANGNETLGSINDADRLAVIDKDNMYVGFFASRNAKVTYTDIYLSTSDANTAPCSFTPAAYNLSFTNLSNLSTSSTDYTVAFRANFDGTTEITQDGQIIESAGAVTAGQIYELPTTLTNDTTNFTINYTYNGQVKTESFTVTKNEAFKKDLYVSVDGLSTNTGDITSPLDLTTALNYIAEGYTIYVKGGTYGALDIASTQSGSSKGTKTLAAYNGEDVIFSGNSYLKASYWNLKGISITGSNSAGMRVYGNSNTIESCHFYGNADTGLQLGAGSDTDPLIWPENNLVRYCTSYNNVDASAINADGFAAKLGVGVGNVFDSCISHDNADDGWDLFNKLGDAPNEPVTIQNCVAYKNGNNGFKLGGEGYAVDHVITDSFAFANGLDGFTCNFNTGVLTVTNCTSVDNVRYNYIFRYNPYKTVEEQGTFTNNISYRTTYDDTSYNDYVSGNIVNSYFFNNGNNTITSSDFVSTTAPSDYEQNTDGTINFGDYMRPVAASFLATSGVGTTTYIGAINPADPVSITGITLSSTTATLKVGETLTMNSSVSPDNATNSSLSWTSSNPAVASIDNVGTLKALGVGTTVITVTANDGSNVSATCNVTVETNVITVSSLTLSSSSIMLAKSGTATLTATVQPNNATNSSVTWTSSDPNTVSVDENGTITGKNYGVATITATSNDQSSINASCKVTVGYNITYKLNKGTNHPNNPANYYNQKVTFSSPSRKGYVFKGWYTDSKFKTKITSIKKGSKKNYTIYAKWEKVQKPATPTIKSLTNSGSKKMKVRLQDSITGAKGYEITYATDKNFTKNLNTVTITKATTLNKTISKLTKGTKYYVKVRAYKVDSANNKIYSKYSKTVSVKIKK